MMLVFTVISLFLCIIYECNSIMTNTTPVGLLSYDENNFMNDPSSARRRLLSSSNLFTSTFAHLPCWPASTCAPIDVAWNPVLSCFLVADVANQILKITLTGAITTFAGSYSCAALIDGTGSSACLNYPSGIAVDSNGDMYIGDRGNFAIRKLSSSGVVETLAGSTNSGFADGAGTAAMFSDPYDLAVDGNGNVYVTDGPNNMIRLVDKNGLVSTFAGSLLPGNLDAVGTNARFNHPIGIVIDPTGATLYVTDNQIMRSISTSTGQVSTIAGSSNTYACTDGVGTSAAFMVPTKIVLSNGVLYFGDNGCGTVRSLDTVTGEVVTLAGVTQTQGYNDNCLGDVASFSGPQGVEVMGGKFYVADPGNNVIRELTNVAPTGTPTAQPSTHPSRQPSSHPTTQPSSQPSKQPASPPTSQPTRTPSMQPSSQPSSTPSQQPSSHPTTQPSASPTVLVCGQGSEVIRGLSGTLQCLPCAPGHFKNHANFTTTDSCQPCPKGQFASAHSNIGCTACAVNYYADQTGMSQCAKCPGGRATATTGSLTVTDCNSLAPNYALGTLCALFAAVCFVIYLSRGRFFRVAFIRKYRVLLKCVLRCREIMRALDDIKIAYDISHVPKPFSFKLCWFLLLSAVAVTVMTIVLYILDIYSILFAAMITWRGINASIKIPVFTFTAILENVVSALGKILNAEAAINILLWPVTRLFGLIASIKISFSSVNVTCLGSLAPIQLFVNYLIVGIVIVVIVSELLLFWECTLHSTSKAIVATGVTTRYNWKKSGDIIKFLGVNCMMLSLVAAHPIMALLRYGMSLVSVEQFIQDHGHHQVSAVCQPYDKFLGFLATALAYLLVLPAVFNIGALLFPGKGSAVHPVDWLHCPDAVVDYTPRKYSPMVLVAKNFIKFCVMLTSLVAIDLLSMRLIYAWLMHNLFKLAGTTSTVIKEQRKESNGRGNVTVLEVLIYEPEVLEEEEMLLAPTVTPDESETILWHNERVKAFPRFMDISDYTETTLVRCLLPLGPVGLLFKPMVWVLSHLGLAHLCTAYGRRCWYLLAWKYLSFVLCSLGIWSQYSLDAYKISATVNEMSTVLQEKDSTVFIQAHAPSTVSSRRPTTIDITQEYANVFYGVMAPRAVLYQLEGRFAVFSAFVIFMSQTPIYVAGDNMTKPFFYWDALAESALREARVVKPGAAMQQWAVKLQAATIFLLESRVIAIIVNLIKFTVSVVIATIEKAHVASVMHAIMIVSVVVLVPMSVGRALTAVVYLGKYLDITDEELCFVFGRTSGEADPIVLQYDGSNLPADYHRHHDDDEDNKNQQYEEGLANQQACYSSLKTAEEDEQDISSSSSSKWSVLAESVNREDGSGILMMPIKTTPIDSALTSNGDDDDDDDDDDDGAVVMVTVVEDDNDKLACTRAAHSVTEIV